METDIAKAQGHWVLAKMGKKVLRPGGRELTKKLIEALHINQKDDLVEFAPGLGFTASMALEKHPGTYTGIDANEDAVKHLRKTISGQNHKIILGNAAQTPLDSNSVTKVYGEAMLTMHADHRKSEIIREAYRILKPGGLYAIHELGLTPNYLADDLKADIQKDLAMSIRVNARPLTPDEWKRILTSEGFEIQYVATNQMYLLEPMRMIEDEGMLRTLKIGLNILRNGAARKRVLEMYHVFRKHAAHMNAIVLVGKKI
jgi:SAM-dependent methyltransferase